MVTRQEAIADFERVEASHGFTVTITQGEAYGVVVRVDDNLPPRLEVAKQGDRLKIGLKPGQVMVARRVTMEAEVTMPVLRGAELSGGSRDTVTGLSRPTLSA